LLAKDSGSANSGLAKVKKSVLTVTELQKNYGLAIRGLRKNDSAPVSGFLA
jgi:hypothetical protein